MHWNRRGQDPVLHFRDTILFLTWFLQMLLIRVGVELKNYNLKWGKQFVLQEHTTRIL